MGCMAGRSPFCMKIMNPLGSDTRLLMAVLLAVLTGGCASMGGEPLTAKVEPTQIPS